MILWFILILISLILNNCVGVSSTGIFGTGVSVAIDPRSLGTQIDDSIMQKNLSARILLMDKKYLLSVKTKVLDELGKMLKISKERVRQIETKAFWYSEPNEKRILACYWLHKT